MSLNNKIGWCYNNKIYHNKIQALEASNYNINELEFQYNKDRLDGYDFSVEPKLSWETLLYDTVVKLRDSASTLALWYSGGCDSQTILDVFARYNIKLDEIVFYDKKYKPYDYYDTEVKYVQSKINEFKLLQPNCNIRIVDVGYTNAQSFYKKLDEEWVLSPFATTRFGKNMRYNIIENNQQLFKDFHDINRIDIHANDKPRLTLYNNNWYMVFMDSLEYDTSHYGFHNFYWDNLDILCKQSHMATRFFESLSGFTESRLHEIQSNEPGLIYRDYCKAIGRSIPADEWMAFGYSKYTSMRNHEAYEGRVMESFLAKNNDSSWEIFKQGINYMNSKMTVHNLKTSNGGSVGDTVLSKSYFLKNFQDKG